VRDFLSATAKGQQAAREDASQAVAGLAEVTDGVYSEDLLARMVDATLAAVPEDWSFGQQSPEQWQTYATWMRENDLLSTDVDGATAVTTEYVPSAG
jgi:putative hydroxymethylpyrimidine transport system substrate-binding protein